MSSSSCRPSLLQAARAAAMPPSRALRVSSQNQAPPASRNRPSSSQPPYIVRSIPGVDASSILGDGWYLLDVQAHYATDAELVEGGQLLALHYPGGRK